jgi:tetratricopeptide (TPR) repeat protein
VSSPTEIRSTSSAPIPVRSVLAVAALLVAVAVAAHSNSFAGPFIYDDVSSISENPTIKRLWPITDVLVPPRDSGVTVNGRPILNLTFALNYAAGGTAVGGYHVVNLLIHTLAGLTLFGLVRRTLLFPSVPRHLAAAALPIGGLATALWLAHPLQTESVAYIVQRAESLVGLFYLLTLYCFTRAASSPRPLAWRIACVVACLFGMGSKEVMASAPLVLLLYDRAFVSGTFAEAWRRHRGLYLALAATWIPLGVLVASTGNRGGTAGFGSGGMQWWAYAFMQCRAIVQYLWLSVWPRELVFDYGIQVEKNFFAIWPQAIVIVGLVGGTAWALVKSPRIGFLGGFFLAVLGPSSSIIPVATETMAEHRLYLPLGVLTTGAAIAGVGLVSLRATRVALAATVGLVFLTLRRNADYRDELVLWTDTVRKVPTNARAHNNVGEILFRREQPAQAANCFREAVRLLPNYADAINNLGNVLTQTGRPNEALPLFERALKLKPDFAETHTNIGNALYELGRDAEAVAQFERAIALKPKYAEPRNNLGVILAKHGRLAEAIKLYEEVLRLKPTYPDAHYNFGNALAESGKAEEAVSHFKEALRLKPKYPEVLNNLGKAVYLLDRIPESIVYYERALALRPDFADVHNNYAAALFRVGRVDDAIAHLKHAIAIRPDYTDAKSNLEWILAQPRPGNDQK